jgi:hypothetical protein
MTMDFMDAMEANPDGSWSYPQGGSPQSRINPALTRCCDDSFRRLVDLRGSRHFQDLMTSNLQLARLTVVSSR